MSGAINSDSFKFTSNFEEKSKDYFGDGSVKFTYKSPLTLEDEEEIWQIFQSYISHIPNAIGEDFIAHIDQIQEELKLYYDFSKKPIECPTEPLEKFPNQYLQIANKMDLIIREVLMDTINTKREFVFNEYVFDQNLDMAERYSILQFQEVAQHYIKEGSGDLALDAFLKIRYTKEGSSILLQISELHLKKKNYAKAISVLNHLSSGIEISEKFTKTVLDIQKEINSDDLHLNLKSMTNKTIQKKIIQSLIKTISFKNLERDFSLIKLLDSQDDRDAEYAKIIDRLLEDSKVDVNKIRQTIEQVSRNSREKQWSKLISFFSFHRGFKSAENTFY